MNHFGSGLTFGGRLRIARTFRRYKHYIQQKNDHQSCSVAPCCICEISHCCVGRMFGKFGSRGLYNRGSLHSFEGQSWRKQKSVLLAAVGSTTCPASLTFMKSRKTLHSARHPTHTCSVCSKGRRS